MPSWAHSKASVKSRFCSIVAVHGLGGHAFNTWTHPGTDTCWVRDLLHDRLPGTRIMVFGYNAKRLHHNAELDFLDVAGQLIAGLTRLRELPEVGTGTIGPMLRSSKANPIQEQNRLIVFLAHSLGGLIVKKAIFSSPTLNFIR